MFLTTDADKPASFNIRHIVLIRETASQLLRRFGTIIFEMAFNNQLSIIIII